MERPTAVRRSYARRALERPGAQGFALLYFAYVLLPVAAGLDKFAGSLVDWRIYLSPTLARFSGMDPERFMRGVGVIEVAAGMLVLLKPRWGAPVVGLWLCAIVVNLLQVPGFYDVALRDAALAAGAFALWRLSSER